MHLIGKTWILHWARTPQSVSEDRALKYSLSMRHTHFKFTHSHTTHGTSHSEDFLTFPLRNSKQPNYKHVKRRLPSVSPYSSECCSEHLFWVTNLSANRKIEFLRQSENRIFVAGRGLSFSLKHAFHKCVVGVTYVLSVFVLYLSMGHWEGGTASPCKNPR